MRELDLNVLRDEINEIDSSLAEIFEKRMDIVSRIAEYKIKNDVPVLNIEREAEVIKKILENLNNKSLSKEMEDFFREIMRISKNFQYKYKGID